MSTDNDSDTILDRQNNSLLAGMETDEALRLYSDTDATYRITFECGRAEAAQRQRRAGVGTVTEEGYVREVPHEYFAHRAGQDPNATVEEVQ